MKNIIKRFYVTLFLLFLIMGFVSANPSGLVGLITNKGLQFIGAPSFVTNLLGLGNCVSSGGTGCLYDIAKGQIVGLVLSQIASLNPEIGKLINLYNEIQPWIKEGRALIKQDLRVMDNGIIESGEIDLKDEEKDISRFISPDFEDGQVKARNIKLVFDKDSTKVIFDKESGSFEISGNKFDNIKPSKNSFIKLDKEGKILEASFMTGSKGGEYNFNGVKIKVPKNSEVNYRFIGNNFNFLELNVEANSLVEAPVFEENSYGIFKVNSLSYSPSSGTLRENSFLFKNKYGEIRVKGTIMVDNNIPEGYISGMSGERSVLINDKIRVTAKSGHIVRLTPEFSKEYNNFFYRDGSYFANGNMRVYFNSPNNQGSVDMDLFGKQGVKFRLTDSNLDMALFTLNDVPDYVEPSVIRVGNRVLSFSDPDGDGIYELVQPTISSLNNLPNSNIEKISPLDIDTSFKYFPNYNSQINFDTSSSYIANGEIKGNVLGTDYNRDSSNAQEFKVIYSYSRKVSSDSDQWFIDNLFGSRQDSLRRVKANYGESRGKLKSHKGVDILALDGASYYSPFDNGQVVYSGVGRGYGNIVIIKYPERGVTLAFAHNKKNTVKTGDFVDRTTKIAEVGSTGRATGPHIHLEVREGLANDYYSFITKLKAKNPIDYLFNYM
ncbi:MAG: M23 family metallopeptidase [Candidatus Pacearchaeota archaeon]